MEDVDRGENSEDQTILSTGKRFGQTPFVLSPPPNPSQLQLKGKTCPLELEDEDGDLYVH